MKDSVDAATGRSPEWFLVEIVQPTVEEFLRHRDCIRRGMLAALAVNSLADHIAVAQSKRSGVLSLHPPGALSPEKQGKRVRREVSGFRRHCADHNVDFGLVRDVADATKHAWLDRGDARIRDVSGVQRHVEPITGRDGSPILLRDGSVLATGGVVVVLPDGERHFLARLLVGAVASLRKETGQ